MSHVGSVTESINVTRTGLSSRRPVIGRGGSLEDFISIGRN
jgi:hypothetical protein